MTNHISRAVEGRNAHPADELADIRAEIKYLQFREALLREHLLKHPKDRIGEAYEAVIDEQSTKRLDREKLEAALGNLDEFKSDTTCNVVRVKKRAYATGVSRWRVI
jgi:hypothetical protein